MKAWLLDQLNGIESLRLATVPDPEQNQGEAIVELDFAALNPADYYLAQNQYPAKPKLPHILGRDGVGTIREVGDDKGGFSVGDRVVLLRSEVGVNRPGTFAGRVAVPVESLAAVPTGWTPAEAAAAPLVYLTAFQALDQWGALPPSTVLVTGASGGVGVATVQLASAAGHRVIALSRSPEKRQQLQAIAKVSCLDSADPSWPDTLKESLGHSRVDLAVDSVAGPGFNQVLSVMGHNGRISVVGRLAGEVPHFNTAALFFRRIKIGGVAVGDFTPPQSQAAWKRIVEILNGVKMKPLIDSVFEFDDIKAAFAKLQKGPMGKVLVRTR